MTEKLLADFLNKQTFDIRKTENGRWIDQKCAPDEVSFVAECVLSLLRESGGNQFRSPEVWKSDHAVTKVQTFFGKPDPLDKTTLDEYNKFFRQPLKMLSAAGVMKERRDGRGILFELLEPDVLEYLARTDWNSYQFLCLYIEKTLKDSGLWDPFATFLERQTDESYSEMKRKFEVFCLRHTPIDTEIEARRIFAKVLNPLACREHKRGTVAGHCSNTVITFDMLRYNRVNWRDAGKSKNVSRQNQCKRNALPSETYFTMKAKDEVKQFNKEFNGEKSEVLYPHSSGVATQMHHIFPQHEFPALSSLVENIIPLTPSQHLGVAHPRGNTSLIDPDFQLSCLLTRNETIKRNVLDHYGPTGFYSFGNFMRVLDVGFGIDYFTHIEENDFDAVHEGIASRA